MPTLNTSVHIYIYRALTRMRSLTQTLLDFYEYEANKSCFLSNLFGVVSDHSPFFVIISLTLPPSNFNYSFSFLSKNSFHITNL